MSDDPSDKPAPAPAETRDVALVYGVTPDREGLEVMRRRDDALELGTMRPMREGVPIHGEVVKLTPRADCPLAFDVEVQVAAAKGRANGSADEQQATATRGGPAQVASDRYREGWDAIWNRVRKDTVN